jgi:hypothetical protein
MATCRTTPMPANRIVIQIGMSDPRNRCDAKALLEC